MRSAKWALALLLAIYVTNQWSRYSIVYLGGVAINECPGKKIGDPCFFAEGMEKEPPLCESYQCQTEQCRLCKACFDANDAAKRNIKYGTCVSTTQYGILVSYGYMVVFCLVGLFAGRAADLYSRRNIVAAAVVTWSVFTVIQGLASSYAMMLVARLGMGFAHAFSGPASLSMIADFFPPEKRAQANGVYTFGIYVGGGLSSFSLLLANTIGWKSASYFVAIAGLVASVLFVMLVSEPRQNEFEYDTQVVPSQETTPLANRTQESLLDSGENGASGEGESEGYQTQSRTTPQPRKVMSLGSALSAIVSDKVVLLLFLAAPLRFLGGFAIGTFLPQYYARRFPDENNIYGTLNAFIVSIGGLTSAYLGGYITDRWKQSNIKAGALVPAVASILGMVPFFGVLYAENFYASIACLLLEYLVAESWFGPAISVMQERLPAQARGMSVSIYLFVAGLVGSLAPALLGSLDDGASWPNLRKNMFLLVGISYFGAGVVFLVMAVGIKQPYQQIQQSS